METGAILGCSPNIDRMLLIVKIWIKKYLFSNEFPELLPAEKKIANFILKNMDKIEYYTIEDIANEAKISKASVTRFCKRLGYSGLKDFRVSVIKDTLQNAKPLSVTDFEKKDTEYIISHICKINAQMCRDTELFINPETAEVVCERILKSRRIFLMGVGALSPIALDFSQKLLRLGIICVCPTDHRLEKLQIALCDKEDMVFGFDFSGSSRGIVELMKNARENGALTVGICNTPGSPLAQQCEMNLFGPGRIGSDITGTMAPRIAQLCLIDVLFSILQQKMDAKHRESIEKTRQVIVNEWVK